MVMDTCQACGEEHEPPRGAKCKVVKAKPVRKCVKMEPLEDAEALAVFSTVGSLSAVELATDNMLRLSLGEQSDAKPARMKRDAVEPDEEELELRRQLEKRVLERRKAKLRASLGRESSDEEEEPGSARRRRKKPAKGKLRRKSKEVKGSPGASPSSSPSSSSSSSSSSSDSSESSRSRERRRRRKKKRSKFALDKYTKGGKSVKRLSFIELLHAALVWGAKRAVKADMNIESMQGYMAHLAYMCMHATTNNYSEDAYRGYDKAIREKAKEKGLRAFRMGDNALSLLHFNLDNTRDHKEGRKSRGATVKRGAVSSGAKAKGVCYAHNYNKEGCSRKKCDWDHHCISCKSTDHVVDACPNKKY